MCIAALWALSEVWKGSPAWRAIMVRRSAAALPVGLLALLLSYGIYEKVQRWEAQGHQQDLDAVELFSGEKAVTNAVNRLGATCAGFDKVYSDEQDITTKPGFDIALELILRVRDGGSVWAGPECKTWIWVARSGTGRSLFNPTGHKHVARVQNANLIVQALSVLFVVAWLRGAYLFLEQPGSSLLPRCFEMGIGHVIRALMPYKARTFLGSYGADTAKPIDVWCTSPKVRKLQRKMRSHSKKLFKVNKNGGVDGIHDALKASQAYPRAFGIAVAQVFQELAEEDAMTRVFNT